MIDDDLPSEMAISGQPFKVGIMPTEDGDMVVVVLRAEQEDQTVYWLDSSAAQALAEALAMTACQIEDQGTKKPPLKN